MADENKEIETINTADDKKRKIAGLKQSLQSIFGASKRRPLLLVHISAGIIISIIFIYSVLHHIFHKMQKYMM